MTDIVGQHDLPKGDRYLYLKQADGYLRDPFKHELVFMVRDDDGVAVFTGCGHSGVLNMIATVARQFPADRIKAVVGGFHLVGIPTFDTMAASHDDMVKLGNDLSELPVAAYWTGHCTGHKALAVLKGVLGARLGEFHTGTALVV